MGVIEVCESMDSTITDCIYGAPLTRVMNRVELPAEIEIEDLREMRLEKDTNKLIY